MNFDASLADLQKSFVLALLRILGLIAPSWVELTGSDSPSSSCKCIIYSCVRVYRILRHFDLEVDSINAVCRFTCCCERKVKNLNR